MAEAITQASLHFFNSDQFPDVNCGTI